MPANAGFVVPVGSSICALKMHSLTYTHLRTYFAAFTESSDAIISAPERSTAMRTTVTLDDDLLAKAIKMMGGLDRSTVLREALKALIERESAMRLAKLGGTQPQLQPVPRRRAAAAP
jgi:Arc/MetJ family transcription regulator